MYNVYIVYHSHPVWLAQFYPNSRERRTVREQPAESDGTDEVVFVDYVSGDLKQKTSQ